MSRNWFVFGVMSVVLGCGGDGPSVPPDTGTVMVRVVTTGSGVDPDGYTIQVTPLLSSGMAVTGTGILPQEVRSRDAVVNFVGVPAGDVKVELTDVEASCAVIGSNEETVQVKARATVDVRFDVICQ